MKPRSENVEKDTRQKRFDGARTEPEDFTIPGEWSPEEHTRAILLGQERTGDRIPAEESRFEPPEE